MEGRDDAERLVVLLPSEDNETRHAEFAQERFAFRLDIVVIHGWRIHSDRILPSDGSPAYFFVLFLYFYFLFSPD